MVVRLEDGIWSWDLELGVGVELESDWKEGRQTWSLTVIYTTLPHVSAPAILAR